MENDNYNEIEKLISEKQFELAKEKLERIIAENSQNPQAQKLMGLVNINLELFAEAKNNFETTVKYEDSDAVSWFYLASCYDNLEDYPQAQNAYSKVIELRDKYFDAYKSLCVIYMKIGKDDKAIELAQKAKELGAEDYLFDYLIGTALLKNQQYEKSIEHFELASKLNPTHSQIYNNLGTAYLTLKNEEKALENFLKALEYNDNDSMGYYNIASIYMLKNNYEEAIKYYQKAYEFDANETYLATLALAKMKAGRINEARDDYKTLMQSHPEKLNYKMKLAQCYEEMGEYEIAISFMQQILMINPTSLVVAQKLANLYIETQQLRRAKEIYDNIILKHEVSYEVYYQYAILSTELCDTDVAEKMFKKVIKMEPKNALAHKDLGVIYLGKRLFDYAEDEFKIAYELDSENFDIIKEYANFLYSISKHKEADKYYEKASKLKNDVVLKTLWAMNKIEINKTKDAKELILSALKDEPNHEFVQFMAGKIFYLLKDYEQAKFCLIRSYEQNPDVETQNILGLTYFEMGDHESANSIFKNLIKKMGPNVNLLLNSAKCYEKTGDVESAKEQLNKLLGIFSDHEEAIEMLKQLS